MRLTIHLSNKHCVCTAVKGQILHFLFVTIALFDGNLCKWTGGTELKGWIEHNWTREKEMEKVLAQGCKG